MDPMIWIVLGILVLLVLIGLLVSRSRARREAARRVEAEQLRASAAEHDRDLREREAEAAAADAQARRARAEADERAAHAERLTVEAERRDEHRVEAQRVRDEKLRQADALDPDGATDQRGRRLDDDEELADPYGGRGETRHSDPREDHPDRHDTRIVGTRADHDHHRNGDRPHDDRLVGDRRDHESPDALRADARGSAPAHGVQSPDGHSRVGHSHDERAPHEQVHGDRAHDEPAHHDLSHDGRAHGDPSGDERHDAAGRSEATTDERAGGRRMDGSVLDKSHLDGRGDDRALDGATDGVRDPQGTPTQQQDGDADDLGYPSAADRDHRRRTDGPNGERTKR